MSRHAALTPLHSIAHERAILENWLEDDSVYVNLEDRQPGAASASAAELAPADSPASPAFRRPPTPPR